MTTERSRLLDMIVERNLGQPVGKGYIDIIVRRSGVVAFLDELSNAGFRVNGVSWWEYCRTEQARPVYGMGGPRSVFFDGWFAEIPIYDVDSIEESTQNIHENNSLYKKLLFSYEFRLSKDDSIKYESNPFLTPGFYIDVPSEWENHFQESALVKSFKSRSKIVKGIVNQWDPVGLIELGAPSDEYAPEISSFLPKILNENLNVIEMASLIRDTFINFFDSSYKSVSETELEIASLVKAAIQEES